MGSWSGWTGPTGSPSGRVDDVVGAVLDRNGGERLLVAVDQFEEVFGYPP